MRRLLLKVETAKQKISHSQTQGKETNYPQLHDEIKTCITILEKASERAEKKIEKMIHDEGDFDIGRCVKKLFKDYIDDQNDIDRLRNLTDKLGWREINDISLDELLTFLKRKISHSKKLPLLRDEIKICITILQKASERAEKKIEKMIHDEGDFDIDRCVKKIFKDCIYDQKDIDRLNNLTDRFELHQINDTSIDELLTFLKKLDEKLYIKQKCRLTFFNSDFAKQLPKEIVNLILHEANLMPDESKDKKLVNVKKIGFSKN